MKRIAAIVLAILMLAAVFAACGETKSEETAASADLNALLNDINTKYDISETTVQGLKKLETNDELDRYYMISADSIKQFAAERSSSADDYTEVVIVEANDAAAVDKIVTQLNSRLDAQRNTAKSYTPEMADMLNSSSVKTNGNYVYLVINLKQDEIVSTIEEALK